MGRSHESHMMYTIVHNTEQIKNIIITIILLSLHHLVSKLTEGDVELHDVGSLPESSPPPPHPPPQPLAQLVHPRGKGRGQGWGLLRLEGVQQRDDLFDGRACRLCGR